MGPLNQCGQVEPARSVSVACAPADGTISFLLFAITLDSAGTLLPGLLTAAECTALTREREAQ